MSNAARARSSPLSQREKGRGEGETPGLHLPPALRQLARRLRAEQTGAEALMWQLLRDRRFFGHKFRRQHPSPPYVLDFFCEELRLAIELDGGHHNENTMQVRDERRTRELEVRGLTLVRYWNHDVLGNTEAVLEDLMLRMAPEGAPSSGPSGHLLPGGEGNAPPSPGGRGDGGEGETSDRVRRVRP